jgi:hypothetical protein
VRLSQRLTGRPGGHERFDVPVLCECLGPGLRLGDGAQRDRDGLAARSEPPGERPGFA